MVVISYSREILNSLAMKRTQILIVVLFFLTVNTFGQKIVNYSGTVKDAQTGNPIENATIFITEKKTGTITDSKGEFFVFLAEGFYNVTVSCDGYKTEKLLVDLREDKNAEITLSYSPDSKKKGEAWTKKKARTPEQVMIIKQKSKTVKNS